MSFGPWSFDIARDGSIWLLDEINNRLLVWRPGLLNQVAQTVILPFRAAVDIAVSSNGTIYVTSMPAGGAGDQRAGQAVHVQPVLAPGCRQVPVDRSTSSRSAPAVPR